MSVSERITCDICGAEIAKREDRCWSIDLVQRYPDYKDDYFVAFAEDSCPQCCKELDAILRHSVESFLIEKKRRNRNE